MLPFIVAPVGASAVLVFVVPASPLAQPWPVIGGNVVSTLTGVGVLRLVDDPLVGAGIAVGAAIAVMSVLRCLHPPCGAVALLAVIGSSAITGAGPFLALFPVGVNSVVLVAMGWLFHRLTGHAYPHRTAPIDPAERRSRFRAEDVDRALARTGETFDISKEDIGLDIRALPVLATTGSSWARSVCASSSTRPAGSARWPRPRRRPWRNCARGPEPRPDRRARARRGDRRRGGRAARHGHPDRLLVALCRALTDPDLSS